MSGVAPAFVRAAIARAGASRSLPTAPAGAGPAPAVRDDRYLLVTGIMIWVLVMLMIVPDGFDYASLNTAEAPEAGSTLSRLLWLGLLGGGIAITLLRAPSAWRLARWLNPFLLAFAGLALASVLWSIDPEVTARRMIRVLTIVFDSIAFALAGWHAARFQRVLRGVITAVLLGSLVFGIGWPELAIHNDLEGVLVGCWRGLASHKNGLGDIACVGLLLWYHAWLSKDAPLLPVLAGSAAAVACLILSGSSTSIVATAFTLLFVTMVLRSPPGLRRFMPYFVALFVIALLTYSLALLQVVPGLYTLLSPIGAITGKDLTMTGRTDIWDIMFEHIRLHPWLGTGYGAFWTGLEEGSPSFEFMLRLQFYPASAHNGYLDILNDLGAVGLVVLLGYLATFLVQSLRLLKTDRGQAALFLALFLQQAITNLSESRWFSPLSVDFVIMTLATAALARTLLERRGHGIPAEAQRTRSSRPAVFLIPRARAQPP